MDAFKSLRVKLYGTTSEEAGSLSVLIFAKERREVKMTDELNVGGAQIDRNTEHRVPKSRDLGEKTDSMGTTAEFDPCKVPKITDVGGWCWKASWIVA